MSCQTDRGLSLANSVPLGWPLCQDRSTDGALSITRGNTSGASADMIGNAALRLRAFIDGTARGPAPSATPPLVPTSTPSVAPFCSSKPELDQTSKCRSRRRRPPRLMRVWLDAIEPRPDLRPTVHQHATHLLGWLRDDPRVAGKLVLAADLERVYPQLCGLKGWQPYPWNTLARELRSLTGSKKRYCWHNRQRLRVYRVPGAKRPH